MCVWSRIRKQVSRAETSNYIPQLLCYTITCPDPWYFTIVCQIYLREHQGIFWFLIISKQRDGIGSCNHSSCKTTKVILFVDTMAPDALVTQGALRHEGIRGHRLFIISPTLYSSSSTKSVDFVSFSLSWASCHKRKIAHCACAGNAGNVFPATAG